MTSKSLLLLFALMSVPAAVPQVPGTNTPWDNVSAVIEEAHNAHNYTQEWTCHDYTLDAMERLRASGYDSHYMLGIPRNESHRSHAWVRVCIGTCRDFDVTYGTEPPPYGDYREVLECSDSGEEISCMKGLITVRMDS